MSDPTSILVSGINQVTIGEPGEIFSPTVLEDPIIDDVSQPKISPNPWFKSPIDELSDLVSNPSDPSADCVVIPIDELAHVVSNPSAKQVLLLDGETSPVVVIPVFPEAHPLFHGEQVNFLQEGDSVFFCAETNQLYFTRDGKRSTVFVLPGIPEDRSGKFPFLDYFLRFLARTHGLWLNPYEETTGTQKSWTFYKKSDDSSDVATKIFKPYSW